MLCKLKDITVYYEQYGEGRPLILLHGRPTDHRHMVKDFEPLFQQRQGWKRIYPDMPGMGKTPGANWIKNQDHVLDILLDFLDVVIPGERFCAAGVSYGGFMAQGVVLRRAEMMDGALFMTPSMGVHPDKRNLPDHVILVEDEKIMTEMEPEIGAFFRGFAVIQSRELLDSFLIDVIPAVEIADHDFLDSIEEPFNFSLNEGKLLAPFQKPVLFLLGRQDAVVGYADAWRVLEDYPRASFVVLDRAGHGLGVEQKGLFRMLAQEWLDRVEEAPHSVM